MAPLKLFRDLKVDNSFTVVFYDLKKLGRKTAQF